MGLEELEEWWSQRDQIISYVKELEAHVRELEELVRSFKYGAGESVV